MRRRVLVAWIALCVPLLACNVFGVGEPEPTSVPPTVQPATPRPPTPTISLPALRSTPTDFALSTIPTSPVSVQGGQSVPTAQFPPRSRSGGSVAGSGGAVASNCSIAWFFGMEPGLPEVRACPDQAAVASPAAGQDFEGGRAYYYAAAGPFAQPVVYIIYNDGTFEEYIDLYSPGVVLPPAAPPPDRFAPVRAIGKVWSDYPEVQARLGWAYEPERDFAGQRQFSAGDEVLFINHGSRRVVVRVDLSNGRWVVGGHVQ